MQYWGTVTHVSVWGIKIGLSLPGLCFRRFMSTPFPLRTYAGENNLCRIGPPQNTPVDK